MIVEAFVICDAATDAGGKLNVLGAYDTIVAKSYPVAVAAMVFAARLRFAADEGGEHAISINTIDYDGRPVLPPFAAKVTIQVPPGRDSVAVNLIIAANHAVLPREGACRVDLLAGAKVAASLPLDLQRAG